VTPPAIERAGTETLTYSVARSISIPTRSVRRPPALVRLSSVRRACRVLFGGGRFLCRSCHGLRYQSQHGSAWSLTTSRVQKLSMRLHGSANLLEPFPPRPKHMRQRTYQRLRALDRWLMGGEHHWPGGVRTAAAPADRSHRDKTKSKKIKANAEQRLAVHERPGLGHKISINRRTRDGRAGQWTAAMCDSCSSASVSGWNRRPPAWSIKIVHSAKERC
jgi:hypothetical protein